MAEIQTIILNYKEVVEAFIKHQNIHEGIWQIHVEFGLGAGNVQTGENQFSPAAIIPVTKIGITKVEAEGPLTVDATKVNPKK